MNIIGISGLHNSVSFKQKEFSRLSPRQYRIVQGYDAAAALVTSRGISAAAAEERFTGEKHTGAFPVNAIQYCLQSTGLRPDDIDWVAHGFDYEPYRSFYGVSDFTQSLFDEVYSHDTQIRYLRDFLPSFSWSSKLVHVPHHMAHAASAFYLSGFPESLILVTDGMGEIHSTTVAVGRGSEIKIIKQVPGLHSLGILYGLLTYHLGFEFGVDEGKTMGLAPYGESNRYLHTFMDWVHLRNDGTYTIPILYLNQSIQEKETYAKTMEVISEALGPARVPGSEITREHADIAAGLQAAVELSLLHILRYYQAETGSTRLCMAGGVALNCTANGKILQSRLFEKMFVQPAAGDDGTALGAALYLQRQKSPDLNFGKMALPAWGPGYDGESVRQFLESRPDIDYVWHESFDQLAQDVAKRIAEGEIVAWFQGRMEFGPRALGNRSIIADPRSPGMRDRINRLVKQREEFRPFAPAVTEEAASRFFEIEEGQEDVYSYMIVVTETKSSYRSALPAVTHVDGSARVQTVSERDNVRFWTLLREFGLLTSIPVLLNTSFNLRGQPIVRTPVEALDTFLRAGLDTLVIENCLVINPSGRTREDRG